MTACSKSPFPSNFNYIERTPIFSTFVNELDLKFKGDRYYINIPDPTMLLTEAQKSVLIMDKISPQIFEKAYVMKVTDYVYFMSLIIFLGDRLFLEHRAVFNDNDSPRAWTHNLICLIKAFCSAE